MEAIDVRGNVPPVVRPSQKVDDAPGPSWQGPTVKQVQRGYELAAEQRSDLSVVVAGLDSFRTVNERLGPMEGDALLADFAALLGERIENVTHLVSDQLIGVMPGLDVPRAVALAEALREDVAGSMITGAGKVTASFGVAMYPGSAEIAEELVYGAQAAMYWAKAKGGNRVDYWGEMIGVDKAKSPRTPRDPVTALAIAVERKIRGGPGQVARSAWYAKQVAAEIGMTDESLELIENAALLHDVGKLAVPDEVLHKPGSLSKREMAIVRSHPSIGARIVSRIPEAVGTAPIIAHHHEHYDGTGYPDGLAGDAIPLVSRIILVSDAVDAMTTHRAHRSVMSLQEAVWELRRCAGKQFDECVVDAFTTIVNRRGLQALHWSQIRPRANLI